MRGLKKMYGTGPFIKAVLRKSREKCGLQVWDDDRKLAIVETLKEHRPSRNYQGYQPEKSFEKPLQYKILQQNIGNILVRIANDDFKL